MQSEQRIEVDDGILQVTEGDQSRHELEVRGVFAKVRNEFDDFGEQDP